VYTTEDRPDKSNLNNDLRAIMW